MKLGMKARPIRCLVTAGPTREFFDPVRFISNPSSGKMGYALAKAAVEAGWEVNLVSGPVSLQPPAGLAGFSPVVTGEEMYREVSRLFPQQDILIMTAAVCDMRPKYYQQEKAKKGDLAMTVEFEPVVDILKTVSRARRARQVTVGFAAETHDVENYARTKLKEKQLDWIVANRVGGERSAFASDDNQVILLGADGVRHEIGPASKNEVSRELIRLVAGSIG